MGSIPKGYICICWSLVGKQKPWLVKKAETDINLYMAKMYFLPVTGMKAKVFELQCKDFNFVVGFFFVCLQSFFSTETVYV